MCFKLSIYFINLIINMTIVYIDLIRYEHPGVQRIDIFYVSMAMSLFCK